MAAWSCGSSITSSGPQLGLLDPEQPRAAVPDITITSAGIAPLVLHVDHPVTVTFINHDTVPHKMEAAPELGWDDCPELHGFGTLKPGQSGSISFTEIDVVCPYQDAADPTNKKFQGYIAIH